MNVARIEFTAEDLPVDVLGVASVRDDVLLFIWNRPAILQGIEARGGEVVLDGLMATATLMVAGVLNGDTPIRLRAVS